MATWGASEPMTSYRVDEVVEVIESTGAPVKIGRVEEVDRTKGVAILFEDGKRTWYAHTRWCQSEWSKGFSMRLRAPSK